MLSNDWVFIGGVFFVPEEVIGLQVNNKDPMTSIMFFRNGGHMYCNAPQSDVFNAIMAFWDQNNTEVHAQSTEEKLNAFLDITEPEKT